MTMRRPAPPDVPCPFAASNAPVWAAPARYPAGVTTSVRAPRARRAPHTPPRPAAGAA